MRAWLFIATLLVLTTGPLSAKAGDIQDYTAIEAFPVQDPSLVKIENLAKDLILEKRLTKQTDSCGQVLSFRGPRSIRSPETERLWVHGISNELASLYLDENIQMALAPLNYSDLRLKITLLADRGLQSYQVPNVERLAKAIYFATRREPLNYYFFFGDYLDTQAGWMTAVALVKIDSGEALFLTNTGHCF